MKREDSVEEAFVKACFHKNEDPNIETLEIEDATFAMAEIYEHILFGNDCNWDFSEEGLDYMPPEEIVEVNWGLLRKFTQMHKGEQAAEPDDTKEDRQKAMQYCLDFIKEKYNKEIGLPNPKELPWDLLDEQKQEISSKNLS